MASDPPSTLPAARLVRFGDYEADLRSGELRRGGHLVHLQEKPFQVLAALLERPGDVVLREELWHRLWPADTFVDFDHNLHTAVAKLRRALRDSADRPRYVETLPRRGYRFLAAVEAGPAAGPVPETAAPGPAAPPPPPPRHRGPWLAALALALAAMALLSAGLREGRRAPSGGPVRLVVLPFAGPAEAAHWSDGLTEELSTHLARLQPARLAVIARSSALSYRGTGAPAERIARELDADYLLEGSVRLAGDRLRVGVRLIRAADRATVWSETYEEDRSDVFAVQSRITARVASSLALSLLPGQPRARARAGTTDVAAYEAYLRGLHEGRRHTPEGFEASLAHLERAVELDPGYALAFATLARAHNAMALGPGAAPDAAFARARAAAQAALDLFEPLPEAHSALAFIRVYADRDLPAAEAELRRALELDPGDPLAWYGLAGLLSMRGRHPEAVAAARRALALDPMSPPVRSDLGWFHLFAGDHHTALALCGEVLRRDPTSTRAARCQWLALDRTGHEREALAAARRTLLLRGVDPAGVARLDRLGAADGLREALRLEVGFWREEERQGRPSAYPLSRALAELGQRDEALRWLRLAVDRNDARALFARVEPCFETLRGDARFEALVAELGQRRRGRRRR